MEGCGAGGKRRAPELAQVESVDDVAAWLEAVIDGGGCGELQSASDLTFALVIAFSRVATGENAITSANV